MPERLILLPWSMLRLVYSDAELSRLNALVALQDALGRLEYALQYPLAAGTPALVSPDAIFETTKDR